MFRQGDVLVMLVSVIPENVVPIDRDQERIVLAYGEVTGHAHAITNRVAQFFKSANGDRFLDLLEDSTLNHEEHSTILLPAGKYKVIQQREYSPEAIRNVAD